MNPLLPRLPESTLWQQSEFLRQRIEVATKALVRRSQLSPAAWRYAQTRLFGRVTGRLELANPEDEQHFERTETRDLHMDDNGKLFEITLANVADGYVRIDDETVSPMFVPGQRLVDTDGNALGTVVSVDVARGVLTMRGPRDDSPDKL